MNTIFINQSDKADIVDQAFRSVKWAGLTNLIPRFITPVSTMVLAALLTPPDFGIVAAATVVISLAQIVIELGVGPAVIQRRELVDEAASIAFWVSLLMAILLYGVLWLIAPSIARIYQIPVLSEVIRVSGLSLFLSALISIPKALLMRQLEFQRLFWIGAIPLIITALTSVTLALLGGNFWALVIGLLAGQTVNVLLVWRVSKWKPKLIFRHSIFLSLFSFSFWILVSHFQTWLFLYADSGIAGYFLGASMLGVYSLGFNFANLLPGMVSSTISTVAYPAFCALQNNRREVGLDLLKIQTLASAVIFPVCFGLSAVANPVVSLLYGDRWPNLGLVIQFLVIMPGLSHLWSLNADGYRAVGRPEMWTKVAGLTLLILIPLLLLAGPYGLIVFVFARFGGALLLPLLNITIGSRILSVSVKEQMNSLVVPLGCAIPMHVLVLALSYLLSPFEGLVGWMKVSFMIVAGISIYVALLWRINRGLWQQLLLSTRRVVAF